MNGEIVTGVAAPGAVTTAGPEPPSVQAAALASLPTYVPLHQRTSMLPVVPAADDELTSICVSVIGAATTRSK